MQKKVKLSNLSIRFNFHFILNKFLVAAAYCSFPRKERRDLVDLEKIKLDFVLTVGQTDQIRVLVVLEVLFVEFGECFQVLLLNFELTLALTLIDFEPLLNEVVGNGVSVRVHQVLYHLVD